MRNSIYEEQSVRYWHLTGRRKSLMGNICSPVSVCSTAGQQATGGSYPAHFLADRAG